MPHARREQRKAPQKKSLSRDASRQPSWGIRWAPLPATRRAWDFCPGTLSIAETLAVRASRSLVLRRLSLCFSGWCCGVWCLLAPDPPVFP
ncbi:hypothetical protein LSM04_006827 [Trypanosoma melophagium]|uniref:uncharacterized protein n=1 Tax=Trypanosoma melophagium TaxID=715481 RepID=UPI00351A191F|nr:hypothetical protein LSM04_006827 [Trypanosoma melophagium]